MSSGPATDAAQIAFDTGRWDRAAIENAKLSQDPSATAEVRQAAEYRLGVSFYRFGLRAAGASLFKTIAATPDHAARADALRSLLPLALELPRAAEIEAPLLRYDEETRTQILDDLPSPVQSRHRYLLGHFYFVNASYQDAIGQLAKVKDGDLARAQIMIAMCHVSLHKAVPASAALRSALAALSSQAADPEARRLVDLVALIQARLFFSATFRGPDAWNVVMGDRSKATTALREWKKIDISSPFGIDALWERAWIELALGDQKAALSDVRSAIVTPGAYLPEAEQLEASVRWGMGEKDAALESFRSFVTKYSIVRNALQELTGALARDADPDAAAFALLSRVKDHPDDIPATFRLAVSHTLRDRRVIEHLEYARLLDDERKHLETSPEDLRASIAGDRARKALDGERHALVRRAAAMVRSRLTHETENLRVLLEEVETVLPPG